MTDSLTARAFRSQRQRHQDNLHREVNEADVAMRSIASRMPRPTSYDIRRAYTALIEAYRAALALEVLDDVAHLVGEPRAEDAHAIGEPYWDEGKQRYQVDCSCSWYAYGDKSGIDYAIERHLS